MSYIYGAAAYASKWQMGFNSAFKGLNLKLHCCLLLGPGKWGCLIASFRVV
jgi:hypothetical protein